jgi:hypothetical protein
VATALAALDDDRVHAPLGHLLGVALRADRGHHHQPGVLEPADQGAGRGEREGGDPDPLADDQVDPAVDVGLVGPHVDPERRRGAFLHLPDRGLELVVAHRAAAEDAQAAGVGRRGGQLGAGDVAHPGLHHRIPDPEQLTGPGVQRRMQSAGHAFTSTDPNT